MLPGSTPTFEGCPCGSGHDFADCCAAPSAPGDRLAPDTLLAWARARGVVEQLDVAASWLTPGLGAPKGLGYGALRAHLTVGVVLAPGAALNPLFADGTRRFRLAVWEFLRGEVGAVAEGRAAETRPPARPGHPTLGLVFDRLRELRAEVRPHTSPRATSRLRHCALSFLPATRVLQFVERRRWVPGVSSLPVDPTVELPLAGIREEPLTVPRCTCEAERPCVHLLAAIDLALARLADPALAADWERLAAEIDTPDWRRALAGFDQLRLERRQGDDFAARLRYTFVVQEGEGGSVVVLPYVQRLGRNGAFGRPKRLSATDLAKGPGPCPPEDRVALGRLGFLSGRGSDWSWRYSSNLSRHVQRPEELLALEDHPRVLRAITIAAPLAVRSAELELQVLARDGGGAEIAVHVGERRFELEEIQQSLERASSSVFLVDDRERSELLVVRVADPEALRMVLRSLAAWGHAFPPDAEGELLERVAAVQPLIPVTVAPALEGEETAAERHHVLRLELRDAGLALELRIRPLPGAPLQAPGAGPARLSAPGGGRRVFVRRDLDSERSAAEELVASLPLASAAAAGGYKWTVAEDAAALELIDRLRTVERPDLTVEWIGPPPRVLRASKAKELRIQVRDRRDWFGLAGTVEVAGEEVELALLLEALRDRRKVVRLKGGAWLTLSAELAERLAPIAQLAVPEVEGPEAGGLAIGPSALGALDDLARDGAELDAKGAFARLHQRMREASRATPRVPRSFKGKLRDYQVDGFRWLARLSTWGAGAVLADDMGLGKTLQALALLCQRAAEGPALVVAPTSVCANWVAEARRFSPSLRVTLFRESDRASAVAALGPGDVLVVSYGLLTLDLERFTGKHFATLVLDEAQAVKNAGTRRARAARALESGFTVALSGTPIENHLGELWSLFRIAFPGLLGSWEQFRARFAAPIEQDGDPERRRALAATLRPFLLRRTKAEVATDLPPRTEIAMPVALSGAERRLYEQARLAAVARLAGAADRVRPEQRRFQILTAITELRLLACHPRLYEPSSALSSSKLARFIELVTELADGGHRALVFSQFTSHLALVREALSAAGRSFLYLDGQTPAAQRDRLVARFQAGEGELFLISLKAGGTGLNLTAADYVVHLDPWWNPAVEDQATDRAHRIGQSRPVTVYRLVSQGTIEETIVMLHEEKRALVAGILDGMEAAGSLSADELMSLIRSGPSQPDPDAAADAAFAAERDEGEDPPPEPPHRAAVRDPGLRARRGRRGELRG